MQPQTPAPDYNFIMQNGQPAKKGSGLPIPHLPKPVLIILGAVVGLIIIIILFSALSGGGSSSTSYVSVMARAQEIARVSASVQELSTDSQTQNLAATVQSSLNSEEVQLTDYLKGQKIKVASSALAADKSAATDSQMQTASTNGNLSTIYESYLKTQLGLYQSELQAAYNVAGPNGKTIINEASKSVGVILKSSQLAAAS